MGWELTSSKPSSALCMQQPQAALQGPSCGVLLESSLGEELSAQVTGTGRRTPEQQQWVSGHPFRV